MDRKSCDFCTQSIDPDKHVKYAEIGPANIDYHLTCHILCMEKAGWTMTYFAMTYNVDDINTGVQN